MKTETIEIYRCGTVIKPKLATFEAIIIGVSIRFDKIIYEVSYFNSFENKCIWLNENEFEVVQSLKIKIGFK